MTNNGVKFYPEGNRRNRVSELRYCPKIIKDSNSGNWIPRIKKKKKGRK